MLDIYPLMTRGYAADALTCETGQCGFSAWNQDPQTLIAGCCTSTHCEYTTACVGSGDALSAGPLISSDILTCSSNSPYCQIFTWPEVTAVSYGCAPSGTTQIVYLSSTSSTSSSNATRGASSAPPPVTSTTSPTAVNSTPPESGPNGMDLAQKVGIAVGSVGGGCIFVGILIVCCRRQTRTRRRTLALAGGSAAPAAQSRDEKAPAAVIAIASGRDGTRLP